MKSYVRSNVKSNVRGNARNNGVMLERRITSERLVRKICL